MPLVDMPLEQLQAYRPEPTAKPDFAQFWQKTLAEAKPQPLNVTRRPVPYSSSPYSAVTVAPP